MPAHDLGDFHRAFARWAASVRSRLLLRAALTGAAIGLVCAGVLAVLFWWQREAALRPWSALLGVVGALAGAAWALRRRWTDGDVALFLDARLSSHETVSTAVELRDRAEHGDPARALIVQRAAEVLTSGDPRRARPRVLRREHGLLVIGAAAVVALSVVPLPAAPPPPPTPPGSELVQIAELEGLERIIAIDRLEGRDAAQQERLKKIAEEAKKLRADLAKGMEKREAQARIAKLRDEIAAERLHLGDQKNRAGLEAAVGKLAAQPRTHSAAKALGDGDITAFDREMQKLANQAEKESREQAKQALEEALKAARERGAEDLAKTLEEESRAFGEREAGAEALRELAEGLKGKLDEQALRDLEEFGQSGDPEARKRLADAMSKALEGLSEEERKRLAENLQKRLEQNGGSAQPMTKEQLEELARRLGTPEGREALKKQLEELGKEQEGKEAEREQGLDDADRGGAQCQRELGAVPVPTESPGGAPGSGKGKNDQQNKAENSGGPGSKRDEGTGDHAGNTKKIEAPELRAKAKGAINPGAPLSGSTLGRAPGRAGESANQKGVGALGQVGPTEVGGVERSEVPEEYREQVGRYFEP
jgi:hypothetical protein